MSIFSAIGRQQLSELIEPIRELLSNTTYNPPKSDDVSVKFLLESLLPLKSFPFTTVHHQVRDFSLCCALLASSNSSASPYVNWIPHFLSISAASAFRALSEAIYGDSSANFSSQKRLVIELMPEVIPLIKNTIRDSCVGGGDAGDEISAASARIPLAHAVVASHQLRWFVSQVEYPQLRDVCSLIIPCGLTALDHWSPEVKGQGMISFVHIAKNVHTADLGGYGDVILDACCHNIVSDDEIWHHAVEMSVLLVTCLQRDNPRSSWFEKLLNEMIGHLERQPRNIKRRITWLKLVEPLFCAVGLVLLAHFSRLFPLFFQWLHADDDETVLLVLERICELVKLTWIRSSPYTVRLVDELTVLYKEAALKTAREEIRMHICQILTLLQQCNALHFQATWTKYKDDPNLGTLAQSIAGNATSVA